MRSSQLSGLCRSAAFCLGLWVAGAGVASPRVDYMLNCMGCHLPDGAGAPGKVPSFAEHLEPLLNAPGGREFLVQVPGSAHSPLSDAALAGVLNWIVGSFSTTPATQFVPYTEQEVAAYRKHPLLDVPARREQLLHPAASAGPQDKPLSNH